MRNLKKFLALVLAMMMAMSLMVTANAAVSENKTFSDSDSVTEAFEEDIVVLTGMGIIKGHADSGEFDPKGTVTRAQMAAFVYRLATGDANDERAHLYVGYGTDSIKFTDVDDSAWYAGYVGYCANAGYIKGYGDGTFRPWKEVTGYEALAMILRAMGYDKNGEFTTYDWRMKVANTATERHMLDTVNKTIYANDLYGAANRELVAELVWQGANTAVVEYTAAYGYQIKHWSTNQTYTLGWENYGLTWTEAVVLGNQWTGEFATVLGDDIFNSGNSAYEYPGTYPVLDDDGNPTGNSYTINGTRLNWKSDLHSFGHEVTAWFNGKSNFAARTTYAVFDRVTKSQVVTGAGNAAGQLNLGDYSNVANGDTYTGLGTLASAAGFSVNSIPAYWSYAFSRNQLWGNNISGHADAANWVSPIVKQGSLYGEDVDTTYDYPAYLLIDNPNTYAGVDMVVVLSVQVSTIQQTNDVRATKTVSVASGSNDTYDFFNMADYNSTEYTQGNGLTTIRQDALVEDSAKALGTKVVGIEITGTNGNNGGVPATFRTPAGAGNKSNNTPVTKLNSTYFYQLAELKPTKTGTVIDVDISTGTVTLEGGATIERSWLADTTADNAVCFDNSRLPDMYAKYDFYLDEDGKYILWDRTIEGSNFVYATYLDYQTGLGTSSFQYKLVGVDIEGNRVEAPVTTYDDDVNGALPLNQDTYTAITLPKRDSGGALGGVNPGQYIGYTLSGDKTLFDVDIDNTGVNQAGASDFGADKIVVNSTATGIGAVQAGVTGSGEPLYLTEATKFIIVSGAGTDTQKIDIKNGLSDLRKGYSDVTIDVTGTTLSAGAANEDFALADDIYNLVDMTYFTSSPYTYAQDYNVSAYKVDTVILPKEALSTTSATTSSLVFVGNSSSYLHNAFGEHATKFTMYSDKGVSQSFWVEGWTNDVGSDAEQIILNGDNVFYHLSDSGKKANDGQPIYKLAAVTGTDKLIGKYWDGSKVEYATASSSATLTDSATGYFYKATTRNSQVAMIVDDSSNNDLFNVAAANVTNLNTKYFPGIVNTIETLNDASSLQQNTGVQVSCVLSSSLAISQIFVNYGWNPNP